MQPAALLSPATLTRLQVLGLDLRSSGFFSVLPWVTMAIAANVGGWIADTLVERGLSVTAVRKIMQTVRGAGPPCAACSL